MPRPRLLFALILLTATPLLTAAVDPTTLFLSIQDDPATTITIQWLDRAERQPRATIFIAPEGQTNKPRRVEGDVHPFGDTRWRVCRVHLTNLQPDTAYRFSAVDHDLPKRFRTLPTRFQKPIRFVSGGDCGTRKTNIRINKAAAKTGPLFAVIGGDIAYANADRDIKWVKYLEQWSRYMVAPDDRMIPMLPVIGNHEVKSGDNRNDKAPFFLALFNILYQDHTHNVIDVGEQVALILLDTDHLESAGGDQRPWLEQTLEARRDKPHVFIFYHVTAYPSLRKYAVGERYRRKWSPLFEEYSVAAVFEHNDHLYKRTKRIRSEKAHPAGIIYIGDGGWGRIREIKEDNPERWYLARRESIAHFIHTTIDGDRRLHRALNEKGEAFDHIETSRSKDLQAREHAPTRPAKQYSQ